jgi:hypothetical protein
MTAALAREGKALDVCPVQAGVRWDLSPLYLFHPLRGMNSSSRTESKWG